MTNSIYSTKDGMAYQRGNSRALVDNKGCKLFQKKAGGVWVNGRHSYAIDTMEKVLAALARK